MSILTLKLLGWGRQKGAKHGYPKLAKKSKIPSDVHSSIESKGVTQHKFLKKDDHSPLRDQYGNSYGLSNSKCTFCGKEYDKDLLSDHITIVHNKHGRDPKFYGFTIPDNILNHPDWKFT